MAPVNLKFETELKYDVVFKNKPRTLSGIADYTLWYDDNEKMGTNLVVVEAKRLGGASTADEQLFAYMGKSYCPNCFILFNLEQAPSTGLERVRSVEMLLSMVSLQTRESFGFSELIMNLWCVMSTLL
jgi:hypothetical protein